MTDSRPDSSSQNTQGQPHVASEKPPANPGLGSVSALISQLKTGDEDSVRGLWDRYSAALIRSAQNSLRGQSPAKLDPEELAQSVFYALYRGAVNEQFDSLNDRAGFWTLILVITRRKAIDRIRRETRLKRGGRREGPGTRTDAASAGIESVPSRQAAPEIEVECSDLFEHLIRMLNEEDSSGTLARVAVGRIAGSSVREIAAELDRTERTVERKLERIRSVWAVEMEPEDAAGFDEELSGNLSASQLDQ